MVCSCSFFPFFHEFHSWLFMLNPFGIYFVAATHHFGEQSQQLIEGIHHSVEYGHHFIEQFQQLVEYIHHFVERNHHFIEQSQQLVKSIHHFVEQERPFGKQRHRFSASEQQNIDTNSDGVT